MTYNFPSHIIRNINFLNRLAKTRSNRLRHTLILQATPEQILSIVEISANILGSHFNLSTRQRKRLAKYADYYRNIARSRSENTARRRISSGFNQEGGQAAIAILLAPILSSIAQSLLDKALNHEAHKENDINS